MDRRDIGTALAAALPILAAIVVERIVGPPMDEFLRWPWAPLVLLGLSLAIAAIYLRVSGRVFGPTAVEYQEALDKVLDYIYVLPPAPKPLKGISTEGVVQEHAPHGFRAEWYRKLGLPEPKLHKSQYR